LDVSAFETATQPGFVARQGQDMFGRGIGPLEIFLIVVVVLIIFGAGRLPEVGRGIGTAIKEFRGSIGNKDDAEVPDEKKAEMTETEKAD
jgi:sec-independent protein translocase protein TatA